MAETVSLSVQADLRRVQADLEGLGKRAQLVAQQVKRVGDELDKNLQRNTKVTEQHFERLRDLGRRLADQLRGYFASIATQTAQSLENVKKNLGMKQQFIDATKGAIELHDVLRKIGGSLDIANGRLGDFQRNITKAFTEAGFSADAAGRALTGIAGTQVSGEQNAQAYALTAAQLAQAGGQAGQEGEISKALANTLRARGVDQNDTYAMSQLANSVRGRNPLEKLQYQESLYSGMADDKRRQIGPEAMRGIMAVRKTVGPEIDSLVKELTEGMLKRLPKEAQGLGKLVGREGIDFDQLQKIAPMLKRIGFDKVASAQTAGFSEEAARGLVRLVERANEAKAAQANAMTQGGTLQGDVYDRRGLGENFDANKQRISGKIQGVMAKPLGAVNDILKGASKTDLGSMAVMGGGFLAATLGAAGANKLANVLGGKGGAGAAASSMAKATALEQITGQKTIPVYVVNVAEFGMLGGGLGAAGAPGAAGMAGAASKLSKAAEGLLGVSTALAAGMAAGTIINEMVDKHTQGKTKEGFEGNAVERGMFKAFQSMLPLLKMASGKSESVDDIVRLIERQQDMHKRDRQLTAPSDRRRGDSAATPNTE